MDLSIKSVQWVLFTIATTRSLASVDPEPCPPLIPHREFENVKSSNGVCYFTIRGATARANTKLNVTRWTFNVSVARMICAAHKATLPVFDDDQERSFVHSNYRMDFDGLEIVQLALGYHKFVWYSKEYHRWDDGTMIKQLKDTAIINSDHSGYVALYMTDDHNLKVWKMFPSNYTWLHPVAVLCQRRQSQPGKIRRVDMCKTPAEYFPKIHVTARIAGGVDEEICFFVITGSSLIANEKIGEKYVYNEKKARQLCGQYGATLPTIFNYEECQRLSWRIESMHIIEREEGKVLTSMELALGISQELSPNGFAHKWDTGEEIIYESEWVRKYTKASYTKATFGLFVRPRRLQACTWENVLQNESATEKPLLTVCQQRLTEYKPSKPDKNNISICSTESTTEGFEEKGIFRGSCYFMIPGGDTVSLSVSAASDRCNAFGGVLPAIMDEEENHFLSYVLFNNRPSWVMGKAILGLKQTQNPNEYQWIDGTPLAYKPQNWEQREEYAFATLLLLNAKGWKNINSFDFFDKIWIICKDLADVGKALQTNATTNRQPTMAIPKTPTRATSVTTAEPPLTVAMPSIPPYGEPCDEENHATYAKAVWHKTDASHKCYFIIPGATYNLGLSPSFNIEEARKICAKHMATLPILFTRIEVEFVKQNFRPYHFDRDLLSESALVVGFALGMIVEPERPVEHRYTWDGNISVEYKPQEWRQRGVFRDQAGFSPYVYMHFYQPLIWETVLAPKSTYNWTTAVLCERRLEPNSEDGTSGSARAFVSISLVILGGFWRIRFV